MAVLLSNNATSTLAASINTSVTSISIQSADASKFPSPTGGDWFPITVVDSAGNMEIMKCTARSSGTLTVTRAQEGTTAKSFASGARVDLRLTVAAANELYKAGLTAANTWSQAQTFSATATFEGNQITISGTSPRVYLQDTDTGADDFWLFVNANNFYVLTDRADDGSYETPYPLELRNDTAAGYLYASRLITEAYASFTTNLTITNTAPIITLKDTTTSAYDARIRVDANNFYIDGSSDGSTYTETLRFEQDTKIGYMSQLFLTGTSECIRLNATSTSTTVDPYISFYRNLARVGYIIANDGTGVNSGMRIINDIATGGDTGLTLLNSGGVDSLEWYVNGTEYKVLHTGNIDTYDIAKYYTGSGANDVSFPLGHILAVYINASYANRNATPAQTVRLWDGSSHQYAISGSGATIAGTWRSRGTAGESYQIFQRVA
ncbi:hypothetical protein [Sinorhizobium chiapasense]|uniref:Uncharacterized protein n=1 Tax=Sinorhizobium chiapasense TaxID=501572 RepID=A0ABZ2BAS5_9HYPH